MKKLKITNKPGAGRIECASLSEKAYVLIREKILRGEIPLGSALSRRKLALEHGMSFLPVSEALQRLEHDGLVESRPRVGTRVRMPTAQDVRDCYVLREALECQAARLFAEKASVRERQELRRMAARLDAMLDRAFRSPANGDLQFNAQSYHVSFHMRVAECSGSAALSSAIEKEHVLILNWLCDISTRLINPPWRHTELMEALSKSTPDAAERAMRRHIRYGLETVQAGIMSHFSPNFAREHRMSEPAAAPASTARNGAWRVKTR